MTKESTEPPQLSKVYHTYLELFCDELFNGGDVVWRWIHTIFMVVDCLNGSA